MQFTLRKGGEQVTTKNVVARLSNLSGNTLPGVRSKSNQPNNNFELIMGNSMRTKQEMIKDNASQNIKPQAMTNASEIKQAVSDDKDDKFKVDKKIKEPVKKPDKKMTASDISEKEKEKPIEKSDRELLEQIGGMVAELRSILTKLLDLNPEEFEELMNSQGLSDYDLMNVDNLTQLLLLHNGYTQISAVLMDENLAEKVQQLLQTVDQLEENAGISLTDEQLQETLKQLLALQETDMDGDAQLFGSIPTEEIELTSDNPALEGISDQNDRIAELVKESSGSVTVQSEQKEMISASKQETEEGTTVNDPNASRTDSAVEDAFERLNQTNTLNKDSEPDQNPSNQFQDFVDQLVNASGQTTQVDLAGEAVQVTQLREIANQIIEQIKVFIKPQQTSMELLLNPETLGKVNLTVQAKEGVLSAQFTVQNELVKEAIESQMFTLKDTLEQQGLKVETIEVTVAEYEFAQSNQAGSQEPEKQKKGMSGRKITLEEAVQGNQFTQDDEKPVDGTGVRGSLVDYTA